MSNPLNGTWRFNADASRVWDRRAQEWTAADGSEEVHINVERDRFESASIFGRDPAIHLSLSATFDGDWAPYMCTGVESSGDAEVPKVGEPIAYVKFIKISDTFSYRISKDVNGEPLYTLSSELTKDDQLSIYLMSVDGVVSLRSVFDRVS